MNQKDVQPLVVTTAHRGVFFGYATPSWEGGTITLERARMCIYWPESNHGVVGLASDGPKDGARVSPAAPYIMLCDVTSIMLVTPQATEAWEKEIWSVENEQWS